MGQIKLFEIPTFLRNIVQTDFTYFGVRIDDFSTYNSLR